MNIFKKTEPDPFADRGAEQKREGAEIGAIDTQTRQLEAAVQAAVAPRERAHAALSRVQSNPSIFARTSTAEIDALKRAVVETEDAEAKATAELSAHNQKYSDLPGRRQALDEARQALAVERVRAAHRSIVERKVLAALSVEALEKEEREIVRGAFDRWDDGAGLVPTTFPLGVFTPTDTSLGPDAPKSIFRHDILHALAVSYGDLLSKLLPAEEAAEILAAVEADRARGLVRFAGRCVHWNTTYRPGGEIPLEGLKDHYRGQLRRQHHGI